MLLKLPGTSVNRGSRGGRGYAEPPPTAKIGSAGCGALPMSNLRSALVSLLGAHNAEYNAWFDAGCHTSCDSVSCNDVNFGRSRPKFSPPLSE